jgi:hypothetical protein
MDDEIEAREYGPEDLTPELRATLKKRVFLHSGDIVMWRELPVISVATANLYLENFVEITKDMPAYSIIIDLRSTGTRGAGGRALYATYFRGEFAKGRCKSYAIVTGRNPVINAAVAFVAKAMRLGPYRVCKDIDEALATLRGGGP